MRAAGARDLPRQVGIPPDVIDVDRDADALAELRRTGRAPGRACSRRRGRRRYIGCSGSMASGTPALRAHGAAARRCRRATWRARAGEILASPSAVRRPPARGTRAPMAAASSMARRLSSSAARRPASSAAGNMPPRQRPVTVRPCARIDACRRSSTPHACTMSRHGAMPVMPARRQPSTSCSQRPGLHGRARLIASRR